MFYLVGFLFTLKFLLICHKKISPTEILEAMKYCDIKQLLSL